MPFIHNMNKNGRKYFSISTRNTDQHNDRFVVEVQREKFRFYQPGIKSIRRIQSLLDSSLFRARVKIEASRLARESQYDRKFYDYIDIEIV